MPRNNLAAFAFDEHLVRFGQEQSMIDNAWHVVEFARELFHISPCDAHVEDDAATISDEDFTFMVGPHDTRKTEISQASTNARNAEWDDDDREQRFRSKMVHDFVFAREIRRVLCNLSDESLARDRAVLSLHHAQVVINFIRAIKEIVNALYAIKRDEWQSELLCELLCRKAGRDATNVKLLALHSLGECANRSRAPLPRAQAHHHATLNGRDRCLRELIVLERRRNCRFESLRPGIWHAACAKQARRNGICHSNLF